MSNAAACFYGKRIGCPADPPSVTLAPWNPLVLTGIVALPSAGARRNITVADLTTALGLQFNITATGIRFRVQKVRAWYTVEQSIAVSGRPYGFSVVPYSFTTGVGICDFGDSNGRLNYARVGYEWSMSDRSIPLFAPTTIVFETSCGEVPSGGTAKVYWQLDILWQFNTFEDPGRSLVYPTMAHRIDNSDTPVGLIDAAKTEGELAVKTSGLIPQGFTLVDSIEDDEMDGSWCSECCSRGGH
jgi:hypothetical protein